MCDCVRVVGGLCLVDEACHPVCSSTDLCRCLRIWCAVDGDGWCAPGVCVCGLLVCVLLLKRVTVCRMNDLGAEGAKALAPALGLLTGLEKLHLG